MRPQLLLLCLVGVFLWKQAFGQAPGDADPSCAQQAPQIYPDNWYLLLDSFSYRNLVSGANPTWLIRSFGTSGTGWTIGPGGNCQSGARACNDPPASDQSNWIFTQYISYEQSALNACVVTVQVDILPFSQCDTCGESVSMHIYNRNGIASEDQRVDRNNYSPLRAELSGPTTFTFARPPNFEGFYLAVQENRFCGVFQRLRVYYNVRDGESWPDTAGLLSCPDVGIPTTDSACSDSIASTCQCAPNAVGSSSLDIACTADGCTGSPSCGCRPGYQFSGSTCNACPEGMYQPLVSTDNQCRACPENSNTFEEATPVCPCSFNFDRPNDEPDSPCTRPPSAPQISPTPPSIDGTFIDVCWRAVNDSGGRDDLHYNIYTLPAGGTLFTLANSDPITPSGANQCFELSGLRGSTSYTIVVVSANGATDDPAEFEELAQVENRFIAFYVGTGEGGALRRSGAIALTFFLTLILSAAIAVLVTVLVVWFVFKPKWEGGGGSSYTASSSSGGTGSKSPNTYASNPVPPAQKPKPRTPPRPPMAHKV